MSETIWAARQCSGRSGLQSRALQVMRCEVMGMGEGNVELGRSSGPGRQTGHICQDASVESGVCKLLKGLTWMNGLPRFVFSSVC